MKLGFALLVLSLFATAAQAEGPATGPSDQAGCATLGDQELKANKTGETAKRAGSSAVSARTKEDCLAKQKKAEEPKPAISK